MKRATIALACFGLVHAQAACTESETTEQPAGWIVGPLGGALSGEGWRLEIPPGALSETHEISVTVGAPWVVEGAIAVHGPSYRIEPEGLELEAPARFTVDLEAASDKTVFYAEFDSDRRPLPSTATPGALTATLHRLSTLQVLEPCSSYEDSYCETPWHARTRPAALEDGRCVTTYDLVDCTAVHQAAFSSSCVEDPDGARCNLICSFRWADCDGVWANGCEASLLDADHCGACTRACEADEQCDAWFGQTVCNPSGLACAPRTCIPDRGREATCDGLRTVTEATFRCVEGGPDGYTCATHEVVCPPGHQCTDAGGCTPTTCPSDGHPSSLAEARAAPPLMPGTVSGNLCDNSAGVDDYFRVEVPSDAGCLQARLRTGGADDLLRLSHERSADNRLELSLSLLDASGELIPFPWGPLGMHTAWATFSEPVAGASTVFLRVSRNGGVRGDYHLDYWLRPACVESEIDDAYEPNSSPESAYLLEQLPASIEGIVCSGEEPDIDYFAFVPSESGLVSVHGQGLHRESSISFDLRDEQDQGVRELFGAGDVSFYPVVGGRRYLLRARDGSSSSGCGRYLAELSLLPLPSSCEGDAQEPNDTLPEASVPFPGFAEFYWPENPGGHQGIVGGPVALVRGSVCGSDVDLFGPLTSDARIFFDPIAEPPEVAWVDPLGRVIGQTMLYQIERDGPVIHAWASSSGAYLRIRSSGGEVGYFLQLSPRDY